MSVKAILRTRQFDNSIFLTLWLTLAAFGTYFCMFAFRKPFAAATFNGLQLWGIDYKIVLVVMQILATPLQKESVLSLYQKLSRRIGLNTF
ncbi:hypothetical protein BWI96_03855 [Siphonobacter sp. SORGH_AS_0500]|nr:hypothetical protein BWI96_03855 [Siphonobacter sp. SORGH_AS_0500]